MAQPLFDEHPLEEYFRNAGETSEAMPGVTPEFLTERQDPIISPDSKFGSLWSAIDSIVHPYLPTNSSTSERSFAERFKYEIITSSLLSKVLAGTPNVSRRSFTPDIPGRHEDSTHSRTASETDHYDRSNHQPQSSQWEALHWPLALVAVAVVALSAEHYFIALALLAAAGYMGMGAKTDASQRESISSTMDALTELISAGNVWDSAINEAMSIIEKGERALNPYVSPSRKEAPLSSLRVSLQSSLLTTQSQCDNVRHLLTALTAPAELSQMSEMYAPSSPLKPSFVSLETLRPHSDSILLRRRTMSQPLEPATNKRATWNGSYMSLARAANPTAPNIRKDRRRSDIFSVLNAAGKSTVSAPPSPLPSRVLQDVQEETSDTEDDAPDSELSQLKSEGYFGMAALDLRRKRRSSGMESFSTSPPPSYTTHPSGHSSHSSLSIPAPSITSASRFTLLQTSRHPLSVSALRLALHGALSAKRFASSHLLALRFDEGEDDSYWEDVRSIMALLTSTFADASSRLMEALDDAEKKRIRDERPSPCVSPTDARSFSPDCLSLGQNHSFKPLKTMAEMISFAPMPTHLARFAAHVDTISTALTDARDHLEECVASLRDSSHDSPTSSEPTLEPEAEDIPALQAYDRLRKELGFALRECERGRERLLDIVSPPQSQLTIPTEDIPDTPSLIHTTSSMDDLHPSPASDSYDPSSAILVVDEEEPNAFGLGLHNLDDVTSHLLMSTSSKHLPPPGIEQVYEAEVNVVPFTRERSKLSREERIRLAKVKRQQQGGRMSMSVVEESETERRKEGWAGPGGEVVQELKDVIWKVGEKRRKMMDQQQQKEEAPSSLADETDRYTPLPLRKLDIPSTATLDQRIPLPTPPIPTHPNIHTMEADSDSQFS